MITKKKENKSEIITFRVTDQQKQEIDLKAAEMSVGMSSYLSHVLADYENQRKTSLQANAKSIEIATQKEILEKALLAAQADSQTVSNPGFAELFEKVNGKELNGKLIRSKYDLLGVLASGAMLTMSEDKGDIHTPVDVTQPVHEQSAQRVPIWKIAAIATGIVVLLLVLLYGFNVREAPRA